MIPLERTRARREKMAMSARIYALQIASALGTAGQPKPVAHLAEVLDASIRALPASTLL